MNDRRTIFSDDRRYRYVLWRVFYDVPKLDGFDLPLEGNRVHHFVMFIGLNPSTADETTDDPTIRRCMGFAKAWGYGALCMANLFAFRATKPEDMMSATEPIGSDNSQHLLRLGRDAGQIVCAWGKHGRFNYMDDAVITLLHLARLDSKLVCLGVNSDKTPKHPLYIRADKKLERFPQ